MVICSKAPLEWRGNLAISPFTPMAGGVPVVTRDVGSNTYRIKPFAAFMRNPIAQRVLKKVAGDLGLGFVSLIIVFNPEALIVGGFVAEAWDMVQGTIWQVIRSRAPHYALTGLRMFPSKHVADSSLLGAVSLVFSRFFTRFEPGDETRKADPVLMHTAS